MISEGMTTSTETPLGVILDVNTVANRRQEFHMYLITTGIDEKSDKFLAVTLVPVASSKMVENMIPYQPLQTMRKKYTKSLTEKFKYYCKERTNILYLRHVFFTGVQLSNDSLNTSVTDLRTNHKNTIFWYFDR